jgi:signal peptidase I
MQEPFPDIHQDTDSSKIRKLAVQVIRDLFTTILPALLIALFINVYLAEAALVENGPSMQPNLYSGNRVMIEKISYRLETPGRGDVVVAEPSQSDVALIKRIVALPGETVEVRAGHVFINGVAIEEPWVENFGGLDYDRKEIPAGHVFILGDNRSSSLDSRAIGPISIDDIKGRVWIIYWPFEDLQFVP